MFIFVSVDSIYIYTEFPAIVPEVRIRFPALPELFPSQLGKDTHTTLRLMGSIYEVSGFIKKG
jgi:hypothetical protein